MPMLTPTPSGTSNGMPMLTLMHGVAMAEAVIRISHTNTKPRQMRKELADSRRHRVTHAIWWLSTNFRAWHILVKQRTSCFLATRQRRNSTCQRVTTHISALATLPPRINYHSITSPYRIPSTLPTLHREDLWGLAYIAMLSHL